MKALYGGLDVSPPFLPFDDGKAGLKDGGGAVAAGGGRGGREDGGCGVEEALGPGGAGKDMMNGYPETMLDAISNVPVHCRKVVPAGPVQLRFIPCKFDGGFGDR